MPRFFINTALEGQQFTVLTGQQASHAKVLRIGRGDQVIVSDAAGKEYSCTVTDISPDQVCLLIADQLANSNEASVSVSVYMAFAKGDKFEHVVQKATELGAFEIVGFPSSRCVAKYDPANLKKKLIRWSKIAEAAAEQSGRNRIPEVTAAGSFQEAIGMAAQADKPIFFYENERSNTLTAALSGEFRTASLFTGPEGGFSTEETEFAFASGMQICTLGKRILRCETAPLCALSAVMYAAGEF